jgi:predicted phosphodiesterase
VRIAILSDIHGNLMALDAVMTDIESQSPDQVWCGGDLAWGGPWGSECIARIRETGWPTVRGNTDVWLTGDPQTVELEADRRKLMDMAAAHAVSDDDAKWLANLPIGHMGPSGSLLVHASPDSPFTAPGPDGEPGEFEPYEGRAQLIVYAHVHRAFIRRLRDGTIVANTGAVGFPMDAPTASYLLLDIDAPDITFTHRRVEFDRRAGIAQARTMGPPLGDFFIRTLGPE